MTSAEPFDAAAREALEQWLADQSYHPIGPEVQAVANLLVAYDEARQEITRLAKGHDEYNRVNRELESAYERRGAIIKDLLREATPKGWIRPELWDRIDAELGEGA